jgi:nucleotide-binding universal stress UspA family protein
MYSKILVPLDGSELAEMPLKYAEKLVARSRAELIILHVCGPEERHCGPEGCWVEPMHRVYLEHRANEVERSVEVLGTTETKVGSAILCGDPADQILQYANDNQISLIVMATHGRSGMRRWVMGSVADKVIRCSDVPVRFSRSFPSEEIVLDDWPEKQILVPLDGSDLAEQALPYVVDHAKLSDAEVTLIRVCERPFVVSDYAEASMPLNWEEHVRHIREYCKQVSTQYLGEVEKQLKDAGLKVKSEILTGNPANEIIEYANKTPYGLIVIATHGRSGLTRWAYGSVADRVLHGVSSPIFLVRPH